MVFGADLVWLCVQDYLMNYKMDRNQICKDTAFGHDEDSSDKASNLSKRDARFILLK